MTPRPMVNRPLAEPWSALDDGNRHRMKPTGHTTGHDGQSHTGPADGTSQVRPEPPPTARRRNMWCDRAPVGPPIRAGPRQDPSRTEREPAQVGRLSLSRIVPGPM